jgi:hypothetical protein
MDKLTVMDEIAYTPSFMERELEGALAAVEVDLPPPHPLKLNDYAELGCRTLNLWRDVTSIDGKTIKYLKTLNVFPVSSFDIRKVSIGIYLDALQQALSGNSIESEAVFFQAGKCELMLYCDHNITQNIYLSGDVGFLRDATNAYLTPFGKKAEADEFIGRYGDRDIIEDGLKITEQDASKTINAMVSYLSSSSDGSNSS